MIIPDANLLLYAHNKNAPQSGPASLWVEDLFSGDELVGLPWPVFWAFARIATNPRVLPNPQTPAVVFGVLREWLSFPTVPPVQAGIRHAEILETLVTRHRATGPMLSDAVLAAIAIEHGATLASTDQDFSRFEGLRRVNPLASG